MKPSAWSVDQATRMKDEQIKQLELTVQKMQSSLNSLKAVVKALQKKKPILEIETALSRNPNNF